MSQNRSRRRGRTPQSSQPGHVPRLWGARTELRGGRCVRRPGAAPRFRPAGERDPTLGVRGWTAPGPLRSAPARSGTGTGTGSRDWSWGRGCGRGCCPFSAVWRHLSPAAQGNARGGRDKDLRTPPVSLTPFPPLSAICPSVSVTFYLSSRPRLIFFCCLRQKGAPQSGISPTSDWIRGADPSRTKFLGSGVWAEAEMSPHRREAGSIGRPAPTDGILSTVCDRLCVCRFVRPSLPRRQVPIPFLAQWSLVGSGRVVLDPFTSWSRWRLRDARTCAGSYSGQLAPPPPTPGTQRRPLRAGGTWVAAGAHFLSAGSAHVSLGVRSAESQRPSHGG